jgi:hypothetical protein
MPLDPRIPLMAKGPADVQAEQQALQLDKQKLQMNQMSMESEQKLAPLKEQLAQIEVAAKKNDAILQIVGSVTDQSSYDRALNQASGMFGPQVVQSLPRQYDPAVIRQLGMQSLSFKDKLEMERQTRSEAFEREKFNWEKSKPKSETLVKVNTPEGPVYMPQSQASGMPAYESGTNLTVNPDGTINFTQGGAGGGLQKPTTNKIEEKLFNTTETLSRLGQMNQQFKPEYLQLGTRVGNKMTSMKDFAGMTISPEEEAQLSEYTGFRRASVDNLNRTLNELSGAAVSPHEAERLKAAQPTAGTGIFDGDAPTEFKRKMEDVTKQSRYAVLRYNYALKNGMNPLQTGIELQNVPALIEKRGAEIEQEVRGQLPGADQKVIDMETRARLAQEFGMQ